MKNYNSKQSHPKKERPLASRVDQLNLASNILQNFQLRKVNQHLTVTNSELKEINLELKSVSKELSKQTGIIKNIQQLQIDERDEKQKLKSIRDLVFAIKSEVDLINKRIKNNFLAHIKLKNLREYISNDFKVYIDQLHSFEDKEYTYNIISDIEMNEELTYNKLSQKQKEDMSNLMKYQNQLSEISEAQNSLINVLTIEKENETNFTLLHKIFRITFYVSLLPGFPILILAIIDGIIQSYQQSNATILLIKIATGLLIYLIVFSFISLIISLIFKIKNNILSPSISIGFCLSALFLNRPIWDINNGLNWKLNTYKNNLQENALRFDHNKGVADELNNDIHSILKRNKFHEANKLFTNNLTLQNF